MNRLTSELANEQSEADTDGSQKSAFVFLRGASARSVHVHALGLLPTYSMKMVKTSMAVANICDN